MATIINFDAIAQELENSLTVAEETATKLGVVADRPMMLKEHYTLGVTAPRQMGKTKWLVESLIRHHDARLITINDNLQDMAIAMVDRYRCLNEKSQLVFPGNEGVDIPPDIIGILRHNGTEILDQVTTRILTARQLKKAIDNDLGLIADVGRIYIDGRVQIFNTIRYSKYYTWLAKLSDKPIVTWLID